MLLGAWLYWPALGAGFAWDDYAQIAMLEGWYPAERSIFDLYRFVGGDAQQGEALARLGTVPWFAQEGFRFAALRPLSSALLALDHHLLGHQAFWHHLHSLGWWAALVMTTWKLLAPRLPPAVAALAILCFALNPAHSLPITWLANRAVLVSACFGVLGIGFHLRWRSDGHRSGAWLTPLALSASLASGEYGLSAAAYPFAYELFVARDGARRRTVGALAALLPCLVYLALHAGLGYGVTGSSGYVDPRAAPLSFALGAVARGLALLCSELLVLPAELGEHLLVPPRWESLLLLLAVMLAVQLVARGMRQLGERGHRVLPLIYGALLSCAPLVIAPAADRLLVIPSLGGCIAVAVACFGLLGSPSSVPGRPPAPSASSAFAALLLLALHLGVAPATGRALSRHWTEQHNILRSIHGSAPLDEVALGTQHVTLLNAIDITTVVFAPYLWRLQGKPLPASWRVLTMTPHAMKVERTGDRELIVEIYREGMFELRDAAMFRQVSLPLRVGERILHGGLEVEILELAGWGPSRVRYRFERSLDDPSSVFLVLTAKGLERPPMPPVGTTVPLPSLPELLRPAPTRRSASGP